ncbi:MAG TPA: glycosyltransferase, partial [Verrucomicrobiae bacterium]
MRGARTMAPVRLIVLHYHLRPGGIRRIIELGTPHIVRDSGLPIRHVTLAAGQPADDQWHENFKSHLAGVSVDCFIEPAFNYFTEQRRQPRELVKRIRAALHQLLDDAGETLVWAHNLGIARNALLADELARACAARGIPLVAHHHDWWFDNRWLRWPELRRCGLRTLSAAARVVLPGGDSVRHVAINHADAAALQRHFGPRAGWLPNLTEHATLPSRAAVRRARAWLRTRLDGRDVPVWLLPCRLLRRKNVAEALLLTRWLRPDAWLVTTGSASSEDEQAYFERLSAAAREHHWRLRLAVLAGNGRNAPSVAELLGASEAALLTSIQEGFGLPYLEAAAAQRPLVARALPIIAPDLAKFGFRFPQLYNDVRVSPTLFDWDAEVKRQSKLFDAWLRQLPQACRPFAGTPFVLAAHTPTPVPFSRLTLTAQL